MFEEFDGNPPASEVSIRNFETDAGFTLPADCAQFLQENNGGEGFIGNRYVILWCVEELLKLNKAYAVVEYAPGPRLFGSDGGGEAFAFDMRLDSKPIVSVPFVGMDLNLARQVAGCFREFLGAQSGHRKSDVASLEGKELFEIHPVILGGSPTDPNNETLLTRAEHIEAVRYWDAVVRDVRK